MLTALQHTHSHRAQNWCTAHGNLDDLLAGCVRVTLVPGSDIAAAAYVLKKRIPLGGTLRAAAHNILSCNRHAIAQMMCKVLKEVMHFLEAQMSHLQGQQTFQGVSGGWQRGPPFPEWQQCRRRP